MELPGQWHRGTGPPVGAETGRPPNLVDGLRQDKCRRPLRGRWRWALDWFLFLGSEFAPLSVSGCCQDSETRCSVRGGALTVSTLLRTLGQSDTYFDAESWLSLLKRQGGLGGIWVAFVLLAGASVTNPTASDSTCWSPKVKEQSGRAGIKNGETSSLEIKPRTAVESNPGSRWLRLD